MRCIVPLLFLFTAACAADSADEAELERWTLAPELRIGSLDDPEYSLTSVGGVLPGPDRTVLVSQPQDGTIRVFDSAGASVRSIGRSGEGPGEFRGVGRSGPIPRSRPSLPMAA